jgi:hypothetical protein
VLLVNAAHERGSRRQDLINENEDRLLWGELYALANNIDELADGKVGRNKIFLLVNGRDI